MGDLSILRRLSGDERNSRTRESRGSRGMTDGEIYHVGRVWKEGENVRSSSRKVRGLHLTNSSYPLDKRGEEADHAIVSDTTKVLKGTTGEEVSGIKSKTSGTSTEDEASQREGGSGEDEPRG